MGRIIFVEKLTHELAKKALNHMEEIESFGGMTEALKRNTKNAH